MLVVELNSPGSSQNSLSRRDCGIRGIVEKTMDCKLAPLSAVTRRIDMMKYFPMWALPQAGRHDSSLAIERLPSITSVGGITYRSLAGLTLAAIA